MLSTKKKSKRLKTAWEDQLYLDTEELYLKVACGDTRVRDFGAGAAIDSVKRR